MMKEMLFNRNLIKLKLERDIGSESFYQFMKMGWHVIEPDSDWVDSKHIKLLCDYGEAIYTGKIKNVSINLPPRHGKSYVFSVFFLPWVWIHQPSARFLFTSFGEDRAVEFSILRRKIVESSWYQSRWPLLLAKDNNQKANFSNLRNGVSICYGTGGAITGAGGHYLIADDLLKAQDAYSDTIRENVNEWFQNTFYGRVIKDKTKRIIIGQRLHPKDVFGLIDTFKDTKFEHVILPARYEGPRYVSSVGLDDWRKEVGEPLWPEVFNDEVLKTEFGILSDLSKASQLQQRPTIEGGTIFKEEFFKRIDENYDIYCRFIFADTATSTKLTADFSSIICVEITSKGQMFVRDIIHKRMPFYELQSELENFATTYKYELRGIFVENKNNGGALVQNMKKNSKPWIASILYNFEPQFDKTGRFYNAAMYCSNGCVLLPKPNENNKNWLLDFEEELFSVPTSKTGHDDSADCLSSAILQCQEYFARYLRYYGGINDR